MQSGFGRGAVHPPGASSSMGVNLSQFPGAHLGSRDPEGKVQASACSVHQLGYAGQASHTYGGELSMHKPHQIYFLSVIGA